MPVVTAELSSSNTATQNGAAVQAAMTAAGSGGGVLFPSGTFDCLDYLNNTKAVIDANEFTSCDTNITDTSGSSIIGTNTRAARLARQARIDGAWSPR